MNPTRPILLSCLLAALVMGSSIAGAQEKQPIKAICIPLADHYPGLVAYEKYRDEMKHADYQIEML